jgi:hypothetical protein
MGSLQLQLWTRIEPMHPSLHLIRPACSAEKAPPDGRFMEKVLHSMRTETRL